MRFVVSLSCLAIVINSINSSTELPLHDDRLLNAVIRRVLESSAGEPGYRGKDQAELLTALNAFEFENQHVDLCGQILCLSANITKGTVYGLSDFEPLKMEFSTEGSWAFIDLDIKFPALLLESEYYEMRGDVMGALPLSGQGKLHLEIKEPRFWTKVKFEVCEDGTSIEDFENSGFSIKNIYSRTEFDGNIDDIFNKMVEELLTDYLNRFNKSIAAFYGDIIKEILNPIL